jgi:hypothetical protein
MPAQPYLHGRIISPSAGSGKQREGGRNSLSRAAALAKWGHQPLGLSTIRESGGWCPRFAGESLGTGHGVPLIDNPRATD